MRAKTALFLLLWIPAACSVPSVEQPIQVTPLEAKRPLAPPQPLEKALPNIQYTIQVGAFSSSVHAVNYTELLGMQGLDAYCFVDADGFWKVRFDNFVTREAASERALDLKTKGLIEAYFIVRPHERQPQVGPIDEQAALREELVSTARRFLGSPYRWGGMSAEKGFDCSGLTMTVYRLSGLDLPRNAVSQYREGTPVVRNALKKGDLVFFYTRSKGRVSHVGIYSGEGKFIHAPGRGKSIRTSSLAEQYYKKRYMGARTYF